MSQKEIREWCRKEFGNTWWDVDKSIKEDRKRKAKDYLKLRRPETKLRQDYNLRLTFGQ